MKLKIIPTEFSVCKVADYSKIDLNQTYVFTGTTDEEKSLVCPTAIVPSHTTECEDGWRAFRIEGIFAISTFNTDYVLTKSENFDRALQALASAGYEIDF